LALDAGNVSRSRRVFMTHGTRQRREHALEWIAAGLVAFFIFAGIAFYSFSVDVRSVSASTQSTDGKAHHRL
jgi:hypothetical protein